MTETVWLARRDRWRFVWHGGRLAHVYHQARPQPLDATEVPGWSWETGSNPAPDQASLERAADDWMANQAADYQRELPYL